MQFLLLAYDGTDEGALERRLAVRETHLKQTEQLQKNKNVHYGAAILDDANKMIGSMMVCEFDSRADLDKWLETEPYVTGKVWEKIEILPCKTAPTFCNLVPESVASNSR